MSKVKDVNIMTVKRIALSNFDIKNVYEIRWNVLVKSELNKTRNTFENRFNL